MLFQRRVKNPDERASALVAVLRQQNGENIAHGIGTMNMPKHKRALADLVRMRSDAVPTLLRVLEAPRADLATAEGEIDVAVADDVAEALGEIGDPRAVGPLMANILQARFALGKFPEGVEALIAGLDDPDEWVRSNCVSGLSQARTDKRRVIDVLKPALRDSSPSVRAQAALAANVLGIADGGLVAELDHAAHEDSDASVRKMADNAVWKLTRG